MIIKIIDDRSAKTVTKHFKIYIDDKYVTQFESLEDVATLRDALISFLAGVEFCDDAEV